MLERDEEFRHTVLTRFRDIIVGEVGDRIDTTLCRNLLDLIAAIQPIRLDNEQTLEHEAEFLGIDRPMLIRCLDALEEAGVLLRRGYTLRIVPDVLADHILHNASVTSQGQPTGYADQVFGKFAAMCPGEVLRNLSELDWRLRWSSTCASELLSGIWQGIDQEFKEAPNSGRCMILRILEDVALYQPEKTLQLVEYAVRNPAIKPEDPEWSKIYEYTHGDVLRQLPTLLRRVSFTIDFLPHCCRLLWELGRDDARDPNSNPDHAMRVLADLGGYDIDKPLVVSNRLLDVVEQLIGDRSSHYHVHSPLDIIDPMLTKTGYSTHSTGHSFVFRPFALKEENIKSIRDRAISLVVRCFASEDLKVSLRGLKSIENALREPIPTFELKILDEDRAQWRPEQLEILEHVARLVQGSTEPLVHLHVSEALWWHRNHGPNDEVRDKSNAIVSSIPDSFELRLTQELADPSHSRDFLPEEREGDDGYSRRQVRIEQTQQAVTAEFLSRSGDTTTAYGILTGSIQAMTDAEVQHHPEVLLGIIGNSDPELAAGLCDMIVDDTDGALAPYLHPLLSSVRIWNAERARGLSQRALARGSDILYRGVALSFQSRGWAESAEERDIEIIRMLINCEDWFASSMAVRALGFLAEAHQRVAIDLASVVHVGDSGVLAMELCRLFYGGWGIPFGALTMDDLNVLLSKLEDVPDLDEHCVNAFLVKASAKDAGAVLGLLLTRIRKDGKQGIGYSPLPILGFQDQLIGLAESPDLEKFLREIRDVSLEAKGTVKYWMPQLFREVSAGFESAASLEVLDEWINSGIDDRLRSAAFLVSGADPGFVFKHIEFTSNLLERAHAASHDCYQSVISSLAGSALSGVRSGTPGQPFPEDVTIKDQAWDVASKFDAGSPTHRFYASLAEGTEASIKDQMLRDEELFE